MFSKFRTFALVGGTLGLFITTAPARADLVGDTVDVQEIAIGDANVNFDPGSLTVSDTAVYAPGSFPDFPDFQAEVTGSTLIISFVNPDPDAPATQTVIGSNDGLSQVIVGFVLYDLSNSAALTEAVIDPSSTLTPNAVWLSDGAVYVDLQNLDVTEPPDTTFALTVDVATVPEPGTTAFVLTGFAGLVALRRRRAR